MKGALDAHSVAFTELQRNLCDDRRKLKFLFDTNTIISMQLDNMLDFQNRAKGSDPQCQFTPVPVSRTTLPMSYQNGANAFVKCGSTGVLEAQQVAGTLSPIGSQVRMTSCERAVQQVPGTPPCQSSVIRFSSRDRGRQQVAVTPPCRGISLDRAVAESVQRSGSLQRRVQQVAGIAIAPPAVESMSGGGSMRVMLHKPSSSPPPSGVSAHSKEAMVNDLLKTEAAATRQMLQAAATRDSPANFFSSGDVKSTPQGSVTPRLARMTSSPARPGSPLVPGPQLFGSLTLPLTRVRSPSRSSDVATVSGPQMFGSTPVTPAMHMFGSLTLPKPTAQSLASQSARLRQKGGAT